MLAQNPPSQAAALLWSAAGRQLSEVHQHIEALERQASGSEAAAAAEGELATLYKLDEALAKLVALPHAPLVVYPILVQTAQARMPIPSLTSSTQEVHKLQVWAEHMLKCKYMSALDDTVQLGVIACAMGYYLATGKAPPGTNFLTDLLPPLAERIAPTLEASAASGNPAASALAEALGLHLGDHVTADNILACLCTQLLNAGTAATLLDAAATRVLDRHHTREALGLVEMAVDGGMRGLAATCAAPAATPASTPQQYLAWLHDHASACYAQAMEAAVGSHAGFTALGDAIHSILKTADLTGLLMQ